jgi:hypothetical protein
MKRIKYFGLLILVTFSYNSIAYKQQLHIAMTEYAGKKSVLGGSELWQDWKIGKDVTFKYQQTKNDFHGSPPKFSESQDVISLLGYGADSEDTSQDFLPNRALNHFFNPQVNKKIDVSLFGLSALENFTSPDWVLEGTSGSSASFIASQSFSYGDAQYYFFRAFSARYSDERDLNMGKMFQSLGHAVHHVQDMSQPEHTRLDAHCDSWPCAPRNLVDDDKSLYEELTDELLTCNAFTANPFAAGDSQISCPHLRSWSGPWIANKIYLGGYPVPEFSSAREFWTAAGRKGLADFSSTNFISSDTPYRIKRGSSFTVDSLMPASNDLPLPSGSADQTYITEVPLSQLLPANQLGRLARYKDHKISFIGVHTKDELTQENVDNSRMASFSIFTERLARPSTQVPGNALSVNNFNLEQRAKILIPRAVGYSTGLINHFFRYRIKVTEELVSGQRSRWKVTNLSSTVFSGCIKFYYDAAAGDRREVSSSCSRNVVIPAGGTETFGPLVVAESEKPKSTFYAVAVQPSGNANNPYPAVAAAAFQNNNAVPKPCAQAFYVRMAGDPLSPFARKVFLGDKPGNVTITMASYHSWETFYFKAAKTLVGSPGADDNFQAYLPSDSSREVWFNNFTKVHSVDAKGSPVYARSHTFYYDPSSFPNYEIMVSGYHTDNGGFRPLTKQDVAIGVSCPI